MKTTAIVYTSKPLTINSSLIGVTKAYLLRIIIYL